MADPKPGEQEGVNVQVLLRCRPLSDREVVERAPVVTTCNEALREVTLYQNVGGKQITRTFRYDRVFGPECTQDKLFKQSVVPIVQEVLEGFNCTIFAYGQTGTGKTYTMEGGPRQSDDGRQLSPEAGVIPRSIKQVFDFIESTDTDSSVKVTFLELYNEELTDLLAIDDDSKRLRLLEDRGGAGVVVQGLEEVAVKSAAEIYQVLDRGTARRRTAETQLNKRSSRSHSIFTITIHMREVTTEGEDVVKVGKLNLVDLAGSENISRSGAKDGRAREAGSINQSLLTLGRVITALVEHSGHVPYRDSKLTRLLRDSLGGKTKTCIIATIAPTVQCQEETISTLDYAHRAKNIRNRPEVNQKISKTTMIKEMSIEMEKLKMDLIAAREKNGVFLPLERYQQEEIERTQLRESVRSLREELKLEQEARVADVEALRREYDGKVEELQASLAARDAELRTTSERLARANQQLQERQFVVLAQRRAEHALVKHAEHLSASLTNAMDDLATLFSAWEERVALHGGDRDSLRVVQQQVQERLQAMERVLADAQAQHTQHLKGLAKGLEGLKVQRAGDVQQLRDQVASLHNSVTSLQDFMASQASQQAASAAAMLGGVDSCTQRYAGEVAAATAAAQASATAAMEALIKDLEAQAAAITQFAEQYTAGSAGLQEAVQSAMRGVQARFAGVTASSKAITASTQQRYTQATSSLSAFASQFDVSARRQQEQLMQQIASLVSVFVGERTQAVNSAVDAVQQQLGQDSDTLASEMMELACGADAGAADAKAAERSLASELTSSASLVQGHAGNSTAALAGLHDAGVGLARGMSVAMEQHRSMTQAFSQELIQATSKEATLAQASSTAALKSASQAASQLTGSHQQLLASAESSATAETAIIEELVKAACAGAEAINAFATSQRSALVDTCKGVEAVVGQRLAQQPQRSASANALPAAPPLSALHELMCPPEEVLMAKFQKDRAFMLRRQSPMPNTSATAAVQPAPVLSLTLPPDQDAIMSDTNMLADTAATPTSAGSTTEMVHPMSPSSSSHMLASKSSLGLSIAVPARSKIPSFANSPAKAPSGAGGHMALRGSRSGLADTSDAKDQS